MQISTSLGADLEVGRCYRLIDGGCEPHRELDAHYSSLDEAIADAIAWVEPIAESNHQGPLIGVEGYVGRDVGANVGRHVLGNVNGNVEGSVWGDVKGDIWGHVFGKVEGNAQASVDENA